MSVSKLSGKQRILFTEMANLHKVYDPHCSNLQKVIT